MSDPQNGIPPRRSLFALLADLPRLLVELLKSELEQLKREVVGKLTKGAIGIGLFVVAAFFGFFAFSVLVATAVIALALVWPLWLAALVIGVALLVLAAVAALVGVNWLKRAMPPMPSETIGSIKADLRVIKGVGKRGMG